MLPRLHLGMSWSAEGIAPRCVPFSAPPASLAPAAPAPARSLGSYAQVQGATVSRVAP
jgi:hypothetical protein